MESKARILHLIFIIAVLLVESTLSLKGVWFTVSGSPLAYSQTGIRRVIQKCASIGIDTIYFSVWDQSKLNFYATEKFTQKYPFIPMNQKFLFDPLKIIIDEAHSKQIKVFGWFQYGFAVTYDDPSGGPILQAKPEWKTFDQYGNLASKNNFQWMNGFHPEVQNMMFDMMQSIVEAYPNIDGIQGDDRLPAMPSLAGYDQYTINLFKSSHGGKQPPKQIKDQQWVKWRCNILNKLAQRLWFDLRLKKNIEIHMAPSPYPWSKYEYLQDWPTWVNSGWVDAILPQIYRYDPNLYQQTLRENLNYVNEQKKVILYPGILIGVGSNPIVNAPILESFLIVNRNLNIGGESFFYHQSLFDDRVADIIRRN